MNIARIEQLWNAAGHQPIEFAAAIERETLSLAEQDNIMAEGFGAALAMTEEAVSGEFVDPIGIPRNADGSPRITSIRQPCEPS